MYVSMLISLLFQIKLVDYQEKNILGYIDYLLGKKQNAYYLLPIYYYL